MMIKITRNLCLGAMLALACASQTVAQEEEKSDPVREEVQKFESFWKTLNHAYVDSVNGGDLLETALRSILDELDPHSVYLSKEDLKKANEPLIGNFEGIGIQFHLLQDTITVLFPITGGPSERLGVQAGDRIVLVDGDTVAGVNIKNRDVSKYLRGKRGTEVVVAVKRRGEKDLIEFPIVRQKIPIYSIECYYMATPDIGYLKLNRFGAKTMREFAVAMDSLERSGMKDLIFDLRGNSGGYLNTAIKLADEFLSSRKLIVYTEGRAYPRDEKLATSRGRFEKGKVVVLIDEGSASASEILSGAIQDWDRGLVIGRRSFGKGLVQKPFKMPDGSAVRLTISRYYTPTGRSIQRPYDEGKENYRKEIRERLKNGELLSADSIQLPDSLKFYTPNKRLVYGGGGIMPDIFVPLDTTFDSDYLSRLNRKAMFTAFALNYLDQHRQSLQKTYASVQDYQDKFVVDSKMLNDFYAYADKSDIERVPEDIAISEPYIRLQIKAYIARSIWKTGAYYQIRNSRDQAYLKAIDSIEDDTFKKLDLSYK